jgi:formate dehydrogenase major subunit
MLRVTINGRPCEAPEGATILDALRAHGTDVPTLCHDERLHPSGACRLCVVAVKSWSRHATACNTLLLDSMEIETHSPAVEDARRTLLRLQAADYPAAAVMQAPDKPFHHWLRHYGIQAGDGAGEHFTDTTHPYLHVDMERCITCSRCIRICDEVQGQFAWRAWGRGDATRILPTRGGSLLESDCVSCGACADTCPTGAIEDRSVLEHGRPDAWTRTVCPYCGTGCEMLVGTRDDRIVQVKPVADAPVSKGHLCVKGRYAFGFTHSPDRVREPMIREGSEWRPVTWEEATRFVATRLQETLDAHGPQSVGMLGSARGTNEENYVAQKFARVVLGTNNVDCCARVCHAPTAAAMRRMLGTGAATNSFDDIEHSAAFLICGCNPTEGHPIVGARIKQAVLRGAGLVVIDPRATELTLHADVHLALRPGTNIPLLNALAHVILDESLADETALRERVSGGGEFREFIRDWTPERAAEICGVKAEDIRAAARIYGTSTPAMAFHGLGMTEQVQGTEGVMALVNLALLTGNFGKPGSGVNPLRGQNNVQGSAHMGCEPGHLTGYVPIEQGRDVFAAAWNAPLPTARGLNLMEMIDAAGRCELKALWAIGYDVAFTNPDTIRTHDALGSVQLVIVQDLFFNELAREFGHVFLPAASPFEKEGTFMNSERRVQRVRRVVTTPGQARADWEIVCGVAREMGFGSAFVFHSAEEVWNEIRSVWKAGAGISYARLEHGGLQWPCPDESHPGTSILHTESFAGSKTAPLQCVGFQESTEATSPDYPFLLTTGRTLYQFNAGTMTMRTPNRELRLTDTLDISADDAARLGLEEGECVRVFSRHGVVEMPLHIDPRVKAGGLFATFHDREIGLNRLTGQGRDKQVMTPEYKVVAVRVDKQCVTARPPERWPFAGRNPRLSPDGS